MEQRSFLRRWFERWGVFDSARSLIAFVFQIGGLLLTILPIVSAVVVAFIKQNFSLGTLVQGALLGFILGLVVSFSIAIRIPKALAHLQETKGETKAVPKTTESLPPLPAKASPAVSTEDKEAIHQMRVFWNLAAGIAAQNMYELYSSVIAEEQQSLFWTELLRPSCDALQDAGTRMSEELDLAIETTLAEVITAFNNFYGKYIVAARWLSRIQSKSGVDVTAGKYKHSYARWDEANREMGRALGDLHQRAAYNGRLKVVIQDMEAYQFLRPARI
jgi:hypothetical protein